MRRYVIAALMITLLLTGCGQREKNSAEFASLRERLLASDSVALTGTLCADYGDETAEYTLRCVRTDGECEITVLAPECVAGVSARTDGGALELCYDGAILAAGELSPDGLDPVSALPALLAALERGHVELLWREGEALAAELLLTEDSTVQALFGVDGAPLYFEVRSGGRTVVFCNLTEFSVS